MRSFDYAIFKFTSAHALIYGVLVNHAMIICTRVMQSDNVIAIFRCINRHI
jgi:hypothetical protein